MIPTLTIDMTAAFAPLGWVGFAATLVGLAAIVGATLRERLGSVSPELPPAAPAASEISADIAA